MTFNLNAFEAKAKGTLLYGFWIDDLIAMARGNGCDDHYTDLACKQVETIAKLEDKLEKTKTLCDQLAAELRRYCDSPYIGARKESHLIIATYDYIRENNS